MFHSKSDIAIQVQNKLPLPKCSELKMILEVGFWNYKQTFQAQNFEAWNISEIFGTVFCKV